MAVTIRLARHGRKGLPFYRIVVADKEARRDGRYLELVGTLDTLADPPAFSIKEERIRYWVGVGAQPSDTVAQLIEKKIPGYLNDLDTARKERIRSRRTKRKQRLKARGH